MEFEKADVHIFKATAAGGIKKHNVKLFIKLVSTSLYDIYHPPNQLDNKY